MNQLTVKIVVGALDNKPVTHYLPVDRANKCLDQAKAYGMTITPIDFGFQLTKKGALR